MSANKKVGQPEMNGHLSEIETKWPLIRQAHGAAGALTSAAQLQLVERYGPAIHRYVRAVVRSPDGADDVFQEFAVRFLRGDFKRADPQRGRFRDYVKTVVRNLIADYQNRNRRQPFSLTATSDTSAPDASLLRDADRQLTEDWREQLMSSTWESLARYEQRTSQTVYSVLRLRVDPPELRSRELAQELSVRLNRRVTAELVRKWLKRARDTFRDLLLDQVARTIPKATVDDLERELVELGLLNFCRGALQRRRENVLQD